jgi:K+-transporting ATPase c subunit
MLAVNRKLTPADVFQIEYARLWNKLNGTEPKRKHYSGNGNAGKISPHIKQRFKKIIALLHAENALSKNQITKLLKTSGPTLNDDLARMKALGLVTFSKAAKCNTCTYRIGKKTLETLDD